MYRLDGSRLAAECPSCGKTYIFEMNVGGLEAPWSSGRYELVRRVTVWMCSDLVRNNNFVL